MPEEDLPKIPSLEVLEFLKEIGGMEHFTNEDLEKNFGTTHSGVTNISIRLGFLNVKRGKYRIQIFGLNPRLRGKNLEDLMDWKRNPLNVESYKPYKRVWKLWKLFGRNYFSIGDVVESNLIPRLTDSETASHSLKRCFEYGLLERAGPESGRSVIYRMLPESLSEAEKSLYKFEDLRDQLTSFDKSFIKLLELDSPFIKLTSSAYAEPELAGAPKKMRELVDMGVFGRYVHDPYRVFKLRESLYDSLLKENVVSSPLDVLKITQQLGEPKTVLADFSITRAYSGIVEKYYKEFSQQK